jgi:dephospho-CoA kinase
MTGYAGSGKDEAGKVFKGYTRYAFADMLKLFSAERHNFPFALTQTQEGKATKIQSAYNNSVASVREFLISDSAEMKQAHNNPAFWAKLLAKKIKDEQPKKVVITDWRYNAEFKNFKEEFINSKITTLRIFRNSVTPLKDPSEHELDQVVCDYTIQNNSTIEMLKAKVLHLLQLPS